MIGPSISTPWLLPTSTWRNRDAVGGTGTTSVVCQSTFFANSRASAAGIPMTRSPISPSCARSTPAGISTSGMGPCIRLARRSPWTYSVMTIGERVIMAVSPSSSPAPPRHEGRGRRAPAADARCPRRHARHVAPAHLDLGENGALGRTARHLHPETCRSARRLARHHRHGGALLDHLHALTDQMRNVEAVLAAQRLAGLERDGHEAHLAEEREEGVGLRAHGWQRERKADTGGHRHARREPGPCAARRPRAPHSAAAAAARAAAGRIPDPGRGATRRGSVRSSPSLPQRLHGAVKNRPHVRLAQARGARNLAVGHLGAVPSSQSARGPDPRASAAIHSAAGCRTAAGCRLPECRRRPPWRPRRAAPPAPARGSDRSPRSARSRTARWKTPPCRAGSGRGRARPSRT